MQSLDFRSFLLASLFSLVGWLLYRALYRLVLSPIANVPGPKLAALTTLYAAYYDVYLPGQYVFKIKELHKKYGPIVRVTPHEVHVNDVEFLDAIYNPPSRKRNKFLPNLKGLPLDESVGAARNWELHRKRREALNPFFSHKKVLETEGLIRGKVDRFCKNLDNGLKLGSVVNLSDMYFALALDVVQQYSFGQDDNVLDDLQEANRLRNNIARLLRGVNFNRHFSWFIRMMSMLPKSIGDSLVPPGVTDLVRFRKNIRENVDQVLADTENEHKGDLKSVFYELKANQELTKFERAPSRLEDEGSLLIMAGTESTAKSMQIAQYHLLANPSVMARLRDELSKEGNPTELKVLEQLPYLSAIILEANRLSFGLTGRNTRVAPDEVLRYKQYVLPPGIGISMTTLCIHTTEDIFPDPWTFNPDRFLGREGMERRKYMMSMGRGPYKCIGINVANAEMSMVLAAVAGYELQLFETDEEDVKFMSDSQIAHPKPDSTGVRARVVSKL
ncbi:cytochrome P450 [Lophiotrema nucula]|uniref:Cytochrome P450 n=1 Tax=Lophiotrema nucula TaxID=690887 RepID=A0A6A5ZM72_9PLEO|nr:cytochrome P450 [Lophiotrema nucula]